MSEKHQYPVSVIFSALAGLMFFSLLVNYSLTEDKLNKEESDFILSRCKVGNYSWILLFLIGGAYLLTKYGIVSLGNEVFIIFGSFLVLLQTIGVCLILLGESFYTTVITQNFSQKIKLLSSFIPGYVTLKWFTNLSFDKPYRWRKEAQLWYGAIIILLILFPTPRVGLSVVLLLLLRIILLLFGRDIISNEIKSKLHKIFHIYLEEGFSLVFTLIKNGFALCFNKEKDTNDTGLKDKELFSIKMPLVVYLIEYNILIFIIGVLLYYYSTNGIYRKWIPYLVIIIRYVIILVCYRQLPHLPILIQLISLIKKPTLTPNNK